MENGYVNLQPGPSPRRPSGGKGGEWPGEPLDDVDSVDPDLLRRFLEKYSKYHCKRFAKYLHGAI